MSRQINKALKQTIKIAFDETFGSWTNILNSCSTFICVYKRTTFELIDIDAIYCILLSNNSFLAIFN